MILVCTCARGDGGVGFEFIGALLARHGRSRVFVTRAAVRDGCVRRAICNNTQQCDTLYHWHTYTGQVKEFCVVAPWGCSTLRIEVRNPSNSEGEAQKLQSRKKIHKRKQPFCTCGTNCVGSGFSRVGCYGNPSLATITGRTIPPQDWSAAFL